MIKRRGVFTRYDLVFNDFNFAEFVFVEDIRRPFLPPVENQFIKTGKYGYRHRQSRTGSTTIEVDIRLIEKDRWTVGELRQYLASKLITKEPKVLQCRDTENHDIAILDGNIDFERFLYTGFATLTFVNPSGLQYRNLNKVTVKNEIFNVGSIAVQPQIIVKPSGTLTKLTIRNKTTAQFLEVTRSLNTTQTLQFGRFDNQHRYEEVFLLNGNPDMKNLAFSSDFFYLEPGRNEIEIVGAAQAEFSYWECHS